MSPVPHPATETWLSVIRAYNHCALALTRAVAPLGLTLLQHEILMNLLHEPDLTQQDLARRCFSAKSGISQQVSALERDGLVQRRPHARDRRALSLSLTQAGTALAAQALERQNGVVAAMASALDPAGLAALAAQMEAMSRALQGVDPS